MAIYNYVRKISDPLCIKCHGYTDFTGQFDENEYEQISVSGEHELPEGWYEEQPLLVSDKIALVLQNKDFGERVEIFKIKQQITDAVHLGYTDIAHSFIDETTLSQETKDELKSVL